MKSDRVFLILIFILVIFGLVMITSIGVPESIHLSARNILYPNCNDPQVDCYLLVKRDLKFLVTSIIAFFIAAKIPYRFWRKIAPPVFILTIVVLALVLFVGAQNNTFARSWLDLGPVRFQPIEFAKLGLVFYMARWLERKGEAVSNLQNGFLPFCIVSGIMVLPIVLQPDLGGTLVVAAIAVAMFFTAGAKLKHLALGALVAFIAGAFVVTYSPHVNERFQAFLSADKTCQEDYCWQTNQANIAIGSGGFWGKGLTQGVQKSYWLPQASDDFIFAASAEELGFVRIFLLVCLYTAISWRGYKIAAQASDRFGMLTATGITTWITIQAFINIAVNLGLMPVTGITLPLVSYGGSSMISIMAASGILLQISKHQSTYAPSTLRRGNWRSRGSERRAHSRT